MRAQGDERESRKSDPTVGDPKLALIRAAVTNLNYARQYLDKFLHWADYILVTHYRAFASAMTHEKDSRVIAAADFHLVDSWLSVDEGNKGPSAAARRRLRAEAIYNRSVLLASPPLSEFDEAEKGYRRVLLLTGADADTEGLRIATTFGLAMLQAQMALTLDGKAFDASRAKFMQQAQVLSVTLDDVQLGLQRQFSVAQLKLNEFLQKATVVPSTSMFRLKKRETSQETVDQQQKDRLMRPITKFQKDQAIIVQMRERLTAVEAALDSKERRSESWESGGDDLEQPI